MGTMKRIETIQSLNNPRVKQWAQLLDKKGRDKQGAFLIEGAHLVKEAFLSGAEVETVLVSAERGMPAEVEPLVPPDAECVIVSEQVLAKCSDAQTPQPVAAVVRKSRHEAERLFEEPNSLVAVIDGVQDPGNLGTIIRSADAVGATGVVLGKGTVDLYNPKTVRSTMGSLFHLPVAEGADLPQLLEKARSHGIRLINTSLEASQSCYEADFTGSVWFVFGNEGKGVSSEIAALINEHMIIPMPGKAESLNVAMAATVLLFEAMRQRRFAPNKNSCP
jgi:TrmH family RNA methyltransferase